MANKKITELTALTAPAAADVVAVVDDPAGSPETKKMTLDDLMKTVDALTELATQPAIGDTLLVLDNGDPKKIQKRNLQVRYVQLEPFSYADSTTIVVGDGSAVAHIPADLAGLALVEVHGVVKVAPTDAILTIQISIGATDMLDTLLTIDATEVDSSDAVAPAVIKSAGEEIVSVNDIIEVDVDIVGSTEPGQGLVVTLGFA